MIYLDTSAMVKLVIREQESDHLIEWLNNANHDHTHPTRTDCATAHIGQLELIRAARRLDDSQAHGTAAATAAAHRILDTIDTLHMTPEIAELATTIAPTELRTLDAIHLATALANKSTVTTVCAYDQRLIAACQQHNLPVIAPGADPLTQP